MNRRPSYDDEADEAEKQAGEQPARQNEKKRSTPKPKPPAPDQALDLTDLGAGYNAEDKRVARAIKRYKKELLPFVEANPKLFQSSNALSIKGYGVGIVSHHKS